ncbi:hypothetical protein JRO89_XS06G0043700 [Xanthoceras sorbifolium]|uniref:non-specific serine/threonine protein kinase n=1 Tax=Xanthoceras sorbifolium TaxID=99658 RepID=A0ABQ8HWY2_9ROSI|nr:hypothetical protein JRO89_XS06G0043700 [Xanthoceras sorbifolium]
MSLMERNRSLGIVIVFSVHCLIPSFVMAAVTNITTDQHALLALKAHITHDPTNSLAKNWSTSTSVCNWIGVSCGVPRYRVTALNISHFGVVGTFPPQLGNLSFLTMLAIRNNSFYGSLPDELSQLRRLQYIDFSVNNFSLEIPPWFGSLPKLHHLILYKNNFVGTIPLSLGNISSLQQLDLSYNKLSSTIPSSIFNIYSLRSLDLSNNQLSGSFPPVIFNMTSLQMIDLSYNRLSGGLSENIFNFVPNLKSFDLRELPSEIENLTKLEKMYLDENKLQAVNQLSGSLPTSIGFSLPNLKEFGVGGNRLTGHIPSSISNASRLIVLDLSSNSFSGLVPSTLGSLTFLQWLSLAFNNLTAKSSGSGLIFLSSLTNLKDLEYLSLSLNPLNVVLPISIGNISTSIQELYLADCNLKGNIPSEIGNLSNLISLGLANNKLTGSIPNTIGKLQKLQGLYFQNNELQGLIPHHLCRLESLYKFYLGRNRLNGSIPECLDNLISLRYLALDSNGLTSAIPSTMWTLTDILFLNLSSNSLNESLPVDIGKLKVVTVIDLSSNQISGPIPDSFGDLSSLEFLNLSNNNLSGEIPNSLEELSFLEYFNVSFNSLQGGIPGAGPFTNFSAQSFVGNKGLCGAHHLHVPPCKMKKAGQGSRGCRMVQKCHLKKHGGEFLIKNSFEQQMDLVKANYLEKGVLVRFTGELYKMGYNCSNDHFKALVMEYMPNGSLEKWLYDINCSIDIRQRLNLAIDVALGLEYLHHGYFTPIIHCDLKPSNILLDESMVAHLSDFGMAKMLVDEDSTTQTQTLATIGYMAPEYGREGKVSRKGDVYSYGVMLMEIFTMKKPTDDIFVGEMSLKCWVSNAVNGSIMEILDTNLLRREDVHFTAKEECLSSVLHLAI